jgi:peptidoglycan/LPS O-acetylase OafA/YrhL
LVALLLSRPYAKPVKRDDIQFLRALAVVGVVAFHAGLPIPGGFLGVDVFFVVSGFVITQVLIRQSGSSVFQRLGEFYLRRLNRLAPAFLVVLVTVSILMLAIYGSRYGAELGLKTAFYSIFSAANIFIALNDVDYFAAESASNPLLHLWSLGVEEQFYLIFPAVFLLVGGVALKKNRLVGFLAIGIWLSFCLALLGMTEARGTLPFGQGILGFYSPIPRAWEFGLGCLLALTGFKFASKSFSKILALLGYLGLIAAFVFLGSDSWPLPGAIAVAVFSTLFVLAAKLEPSGSKLPTVLGKKLARAVGDSSYSFYLWHWPLIVFASIIWPDSLVATFTAAVLSLVLALGSHRFVEVPFISGRFSKPRQSIPRVLSAGLLTMSLTLVIPPFYASYGEPFWEKNGALRGELGWERTVELIPQISVDCEFSEDCIQSVGKPPRTLLLGNSHAGHLFVGLQAAGAERFAWIDPLIPWKSPLEGSAQLELERIIDLTDIDTVIIGEYWAKPGGAGVDLNAFQFTIDFLTSRKIRVLILNGLPVAEVSPSSCKYGVPIRAGARLCDFPSAGNDSRILRYHQFLSELSQRSSNVHIVDSYGLFCEGQTCRIGDVGEIWFRDGNHLGEFGSVKVAELIVSELGTAR